MAGKPTQPPRKRAPRKTALRSVPPADESLAAVLEPKKKPPTLAEAIEAGAYLGILQAQRRELVTDMRNASGPAKAAMHRQFALLSKEIAGLEEEAATAAAEEADGAPSEDADEAFDPEAL